MSDPITRVDETYYNPHASEREVIRAFRGIMTRDALGRDRREIRHAMLREMLANRQEALEILYPKH